MFLISCNYLAMFIGGPWGDRQYQLQVPKPERVSPKSIAADLGT